MTKQEKRQIISTITDMRAKDNNASNFDNRVYTAYQNVIDYITSYSPMNECVEDDGK